MEFIPLSLPGLILIRPKVVHDARGAFVKNYSLESFRKHGRDFRPKEEFYSVSHGNVLRGMHFQAPPSDYEKLVHCIRGAIYDVVLDIRKDSPTYGQTWSGQLNAVRCEALYLPSGFAHGFYSLEPESTVSYSVSQGHDPGLDQGICWDSFGHGWPCTNPIISSRDRALPAFSDFSTPFSYP
jgi:dTDP-4-dehydrorhamnose 3,5-epimerase